jgi:hypothetical protein
MATTRLLEPPAAEAEVGCCRFAIVDGAVTGGPTFADDDQGKPHVITATASPAEIPRRISDGRATADSDSDVSVSLFA